MDDYNAKKSRAQKFRQDKHKDRHKKPHSSGPQAGKNTVKPVAQEKLSKDEAEKILSDSDAEEMDSKSQSFSRRKMVSNWDRYEETVINKYEEEAEPTGALFEELLSMPISSGHLKMKHEHEWGKEKSELQMPWFQLDIKDVEKNLGTIPFLHRQNLTSSIFTESHLQRMITRAKQNAASLTEVNEGILKLQSLCVSNSSKKDESTEPPVCDNKAIGLQKGSTVQESTDLSKNDDLDRLLALDVEPSKSADVKPPHGDVSLVVKGLLSDNSMKAPSPPRQASPVSSSTNTTPAQPSVSLDDWLDSILDD